jgi:tRNA(Ile)-lysidine synthase
MHLNTDQLIQNHLRTWIADYPQPKRFWVAYSGGVDSHVLLHALAHIIPERLSAMHVNHGWHPQAQDWVNHCQQICCDLNIDCVTMRIDAKKPPGHSPEAYARTLRYRALAQPIAPSDCVLTAHHQDDQAETILLQLIRGAGPRGLSGMPSFKSFYQGYLGRPLLLLNRAQIHAYAQQHQLNWIEDSSNQCLNFARNFIRHEVLTKLKQRWPQVSKTITRSGRQCAQTECLLNEMAHQDFAQCKISSNENIHDALSISALLKLSSERRSNVLRYWFRLMQITMPSEAHIQEIESSLLLCAPDAQPDFNLKTHRLRRYRDCLYCHAIVPMHDASVEIA